MLIDTVTRNMNARRKQSAKPQEAEPGGPPDYLYHRQLNEQPKPSAPSSARFKPSRRMTPRLTSSRSALYANLRIVLVVVASMALFFLGALFISKQTWQMKQAVRTPAAADAATKGAGKVPRGKRQTEPLDLLSASTKPESELISEAMLLGRRADLLQAAGQDRQAIETYLEALRIWPALNQVRAELGRLYLRRQQIPRALAVLEVAVSNEPDSPALLNDLAVAYLYDNRIPKALDLLETATRLNAQYAPAYFNRALCHLLRGDRAAAREALNQYLKLVPGDPRALKEWAYLQAAEGRLEEAYTALQKAMEGSPTWPPLLLDAAAVASLMGNVERAVDYLRQAEPITTPNAILRVLRGPALQRVRASAAGRTLEAQLVERVQRAPPEGTSTASDRTGNAPLLSAPPPSAASEPRS